MTYQQTIDFLYTQLPMFTRIGAAAYKKDLHNTIALLDALDNPHKKFRSVHVAGTNGKGSTSHMLAAVFHANGYKTGLYTSPHLKDFRERIKVSDAESNTLAMISEDFVVSFTEKTKPLIESIHPSFFELTVAMAFQYFAEQNVTIAIIETGLGGRLDSTNVIDPLLSIITNIGWDHMNILGDTLEKIAGEKAGIIKQNVPVIVGETLGITKPVFIQKASAENAPLIWAEDYLIEEVILLPERLEIAVNHQNRSRHFEIDLPGLYQQYNLRNVVAATDVLKESGWQLSEERTAAALQQVRSITGLHGRWEVLQKDPLLVTDVGHNEDGIKQVLKQVESMRAQIAHVHFITGMVKDKEVDKVLALLPAHFTYYFTNAHIPRALPAIDLQVKAKQFHLNGDCFETVNDAIDKALSAASPNDLVLVCGSVFLAGEVAGRFYLTA